jgi:hypothetical protein
MRQKSPYFDVLPGKGFGPLRFGMTQAAAEEILGKAPRTDSYDEGEDSSLTWDYPDVGIALFFDQTYEFRLSSIEIEFVLSARLFGEILFPMNKADLLSLLRRNLQEREMDEIKETSGGYVLQTRLSVPALASDFYLDRYGALEELMWGPFFGPDDQIVWPDEEE